MAFGRGMRLLTAVLAMVLGFTANPADARVSLVNERGFVVRLIATAPAEPDKAWDELLNPADWWDSDHSFSGDASNFTLDAKPGGCFCENLPGADSGSPARGGVEHMRVVYIEKPRALRMIGALGPLQSEALNGTLTVQLKSAEGGGTEIMMEYVVGGFSRTAFDAMSTSVDQVLGEQLQRLAAKLGAKPVAAAKSKGGPKGEIIGR